MFQTKPNQCKQTTTTDSYNPKNAKQQCKQNNINQKTEISTIKKTEESKQSNNK